MAGLCIVGGLAVSIPGLHQLEASSIPLPPGVTIKKVSRYCRKLLGEQGSPHSGWEPQFYRKLLLEVTNQYFCSCKYKKTFSLSWVWYRMHKYYTSKKNLKLKKGRNSNWGTFYKVCDQYSFKLSRSSKTGKLRNCHSQEESKETGQLNLVCCSRWDTGVEKNTRSKTKELWSRDLG